MAFADLPHLVYFEIFALLPIEDLLRLQKACRVTRGMEAAKAMCSTVLDPVAYLDRKFGRRAKLLEAMAMSNVYLSGSRALDYFVPGSAHEASDWDFYIAHEAIEVYKFMKSMEELGVTWTNNDKLKEEVGKTPGKRVTLRLTTKQGRYIERAKEYRDAPTLMHPFTDLPVETNFSDRHEDGGIAPMRSVDIHNQVDRIRMTISPEPGYIEEAFDVLRGRYAWNGREADIQLIIMDMPFLGLYNFLSQFHSSCIQCFIFPAGAVHLYGKLASRHQSYLWLRYEDIGYHDVTPASEDPRVLKPTDSFINNFPHWAKYKQRGFEYHFAPVMALSRDFFNLGRGAESQSTVMKIDCASISPSATAWYTAILDKIAWDETNKRLQFNGDQWRLHYYPDWFEVVPFAVVNEYFETTVGRLLIDLLSKPSSFSRKHNPSPWTE